MLQKVIFELDEKKNEALKSTWTKVNKDFGSIFSTLLPGVTSKLDPPEGGTVLDGLEVKVAFNGVWKESLTELSGGQRSLLALSLILSMLLFKPAPMYILDEVDAALDLSHTQNIGHMIKTYFGQSQFIVVSLKQGMFNNANVIFRTKFIEGIGSTVARTLPTPTGAPAEAQSKAPLKKASAAAPEEEADAENAAVAAPSGKRAVAGAGMEAASRKIR
jgi:structural maintenance of chromosome 2